MSDQQQKQRVAAYALIVRGEEILLCRVSAAIPSHAGQWTLPGGGIDFGEDPTAAMIREVTEETGLVVRPTGIVGVDSLTLPITNGVQQNIRIIYRAEIVSGTLRHEVEGTTDRCEWWNRSDCPQLVSIARYGVSVAFPQDGDE